MIIKSLLIKIFAFIFFITIILGGVYFGIKNQKLQVQPIKTRSNNPPITSVIQATDEPKPTEAISATPTIKSSPQPDSSNKLCLWEPNGCIVVNKYSGAHLPCDDAAPGDKECTPPAGMQCSFVLENNITTCKLVTK